MKEHCASPYDHLLQTNFVPSSIQISEIEDIIRKPEEEIHALNDKISQLQTKRDKLQSFVDSHRSLLSPVRRLPRDLLAEIFLQCLPGDRLPIRSIGEAPLLLTTVCHTWREVAITTPRLWRAIHFIFPTLAGYYTLDNHFRSFFKAQKDGLELWLNRSGSVMLTLSCCLPLDAAASSRAVRDELRSMYVQLLGTLLRNSTRWKSFYLNGFPADMLSTMHDLKAEDIPHLDSLFLQGNGLSLIASPTVPEVPDSPYHNIARAPSLRVLHILYSRVDPFTLPVRWNGLTDLTLCNNVTRGTQSIPNPIGMIRQLAKTCKCLRKLRLGLSTSSSSGDVQDVVLERQTWPQLTDLRIELRLPFRGPQITHSFLKGLFDIITTPALSRLAFHILPFGGVGQETVPLMAEAPFYGLLLRSNCPITVLDLTVRLTDKALAESLQSMPLLEVLRFTDAYPIRVVEGSGTLQLSSNIFSRALVQSLTPRASESRLLPELLCPRLETVEFYSCPITLADDLIVFAGARRCGPIQVTKALKTFKVVFRPNRIGGIGLPSDVLEKVRLLKQSSGLNVDWSSMGAMRLRPTPALYMPEHIVDY